MASVSLSIGPEVPGSRKESYGVVSFDSSYPTGGEAFTPGAFGLSRLDWLQVASGQGYVAVWDGSVSAPKILMYRQNETTGALAQVPNATDLSTVTVRVRAVGA